MNNSKGCHSWLWLGDQPHHVSFGGWYNRFECNGCMALIVSPSLSTRSPSTTTTFSSAYLFTASSDVPPHGSAQPDAQLAVLARVPRSNNAQLSAKPIPLGFLTSVSTCCTACAQLTASPSDLGVSAGSPVTLWTSIKDARHHSISEWQVFWSMVSVYCSSLSQRQRSP